MQHGYSIGRALHCFQVASVASVLVMSSSSATFAVEPMPPADQRFEADDVNDTPEFRRHVLPLLGRLGCNGRSCHGSFQGQGGFRLSLFGYDFDADHAALTTGSEPRVDVEHPDDSLVFYKPTHGDEHGGGQRMEIDSWQARLIRNWIRSGAQGTEDEACQLTSLDVTPPTIQFSATGQQRSLRVLARWSDGSVEDVTPLCRYQTNDESLVEVDADGVVTSKDRGDTHIVAFYDHAVSVAQVLTPVSDQVGEKYPDIETPTRIDELIVAKLRRLGIVPAPLCTDTEFLRRISLDMTGTLPTPQEVKAFVAGTLPDKRLRKIDELLERPTYTARWATKLCEITGNSPRHFEDNAPPAEYARNWYEWIARRVRENVPYDKLVAGIVLGRSRESSESYEDYVTQESAYYRTDSPDDFTARETMPYYWAKRTSRMPEERALNFSYAFLGVRIECAQCHKHPFDRWTQDDFRHFTAFFEPIGYGVPLDDRKTYQAMLDELGDRGNQSQRVRARLERAQRGEIVPWLEVFLAPPGTRIEKGREAKASDSVAPRVLGGKDIDQDASGDPRQALVDWMRQKDNPWFARVFINRVWKEYFGVGIIDPPDDMNQANPPGNAPLLDYLAEQFVDHGFDMKWLHREIVSSRAYQRSLEANETNRLDEQNFSRAVARRLPAEILFDAIQQATAESRELPRLVVDVSNRAIGPQGGAFLGRRNHNDYASTVFGRSSRDANCDCSASTDPNLLQAIFMKNDREVVEALERQSGWLNEVRGALKRASRQNSVVDHEALVRTAFLRTLSRQPTESEFDRSTQHLKRAGDTMEGLHDLLWALLNTREFLTNH
ncbi:DUF1549 domain-containing protein [bacterium]|nr:DUF1549 domain-containing protein [bacterium]